MIPVKVAQVSLSNMGFVVFLRSQQDQRTLPVFIGPPEAQAIALVLEGVRPPRPLTHDLFKQVLDHLECRMKRVEICDLADNTFYARLILEANGLESTMDARPSDAIALALRCGAPVLVAPEVMEAAGVIVRDTAGNGHLSLERAAPLTGAAKIEDLKRRIAQAVEAEHYEEAARLRDELKKITN